MAYFLDVTRMANACYFHRLLSIIQSPQGEPLLIELEASQAAICDLLKLTPDSTHQAVRPAPWRLGDKAGNHADCQEEQR